MEKPILAIFKNAGTHRIPRFGVFPDWFSYISHEAQRATALELFDFDQDGHLDIIVGIEQHPTHVLFGGVSGPRAESGGYLTMMAPSEALALSAGDDLASLSLAAALLHTADDGQARVYLAEARSCHTPNDSPCTSPPHAVIHSPSEQPIDIKWPSNRTLQALSVLLTESRSGEPLLLLGRGDRRPGFPELAPHTVDAFDIHTGKSTPYTLVEAELSALHMTTLPSYDNAEPLTHRGHVRGAALTLPGVGPMKVQSVSMGETAVPACGPSAGKPCYWSVGPSTLLFVGCPPDAAVQVRYQRPTSRGVAVADSRLSKHAVIGWQVPL